MASLKEKMKSSQFRHGTAATVAIALFLVLILLINVVASMAVERWDLKIDLTSSGMYELSDETLKALETVDSPVVITVLSTELEFTSTNDYFAQANETIKLFSKHNNNITVEYVDPIKDPTVLSKYSQFDPSAKDIIVTSDLRSLYISYVDLFNIGKDNTGSFYTIQSSKAEYTVASAILGSVVATQPSVVVLTGHGEDELSDFTDYLVGNNFKTSTADVTTAGIPEDTDLVIIANPARDYTEEDLRKLDAFLFNDGNYGKNLVFFSNNKQPDTPNLNAFLSDWGIEMQNSTLLETNSQRIYNYNYYFAQVNYADPAMAGTLYGSGVYPAVLQSRGMIAKDNSSYGTKVLLALSGTSVQIPADAGTDIDVSTYEKDAWPVAIMGTKSTTEAASHVVAFGSTTFVDTSLLKNTSLTNGDYMIRLFNSLTERDDAVPMTSKTLGGSYYSITSGQANFLSILFLGIIPLAVLACGVVMWLRRRHL